MFCKKCGNKLMEGQKFCTSCGAEATPQVSEGEMFKKFTKKVAGETPISLANALRVLFLAGLIGWGVYASIDEGAIDKNNEALSAYDSGNSTQAIAQFEEASRDAKTDDTKINTLINLGYAYSSDGQTDEAINAFQNALDVANNGSYEYYLISGEIADLQGKPNSAFLAFTKAYEISPNEFQVNNALALMYLDLYDVAPQYVDYKKALAYAERAYDLSGNSIVVKQNLAIAYFFNENYTQTISLLTSTGVNNTPVLAYYLGLAYAQTYQTANAKFYLSQAISGGMDVSQEVYDYLASN